MSSSLMRHLAGRSISRNHDLRSVTSFRKLNHTPYISNTVPSINHKTSSNDFTKVSLNQCENTPSIYMNSRRFKSDTELMIFHFFKE